MAVSDNDAIFAECKWTDKVVSVDIAEDLLAKAEIFNYKRKFFYIFSKTGFSAGLIDFAKEHENFKLVSLEQMIADIEEGDSRIGTNVALLYIAKYATVWGRFSNCRCF